MKPAIPLLTLALAAGAAAMVILNPSDDEDSSRAPLNRNVAVRALSSSGLYVYPPIRGAELTYATSDGRIELVWVTDVRRGADGSVTVEAIIAIGDDSLPPVAIITEPNGGWRGNARTFFFDMQRHVENRGVHMPAGSALSFSGDEHWWMPSIQRMRAGATSEGHFVMSGGGTTDEGADVDMEIDVEWSSRGFDFEELPFLRDEGGIPIEGDDRTVRAFRTATEHNGTTKMEVTVDGQTFTPDDERVDPDMIQEGHEKLQEELARAKRRRDIPPDMDVVLPSLPSDLGSPESTTESTDVIWFVPGFGIIYQQTINENGTTSKWLLESTVEP